MGVDKNASWDWATVPQLLVIRLRKDFCRWFISRRPAQPLQLSVGSCPAWLNFILAKFPHFDGSNRHVCTHRIHTHPQESKLRSVTLTSSSYLPIDPSAQYSFMWGKELQTVPLIKEVTVHWVVHQRRQKKEREREQGLSSSGFKRSWKWSFSHCGANAADSPRRVTTRTLRRQRGACSKAPHTQWDKDGESHINVHRNTPGPRTQQRGGTK